MKAKNLSHSLIVATAISMTCAVQAPAADREADHDALRQLMTKVTTAINEQDVEQLSTCFTEDFVFTSSDQTVITNRKGIADYYDKMLRGPNALIAKMKINAEATELTRFIDGTYTLKSGEIFKLKAKWTATVAKEKGEWKAAAVQVGVNFLDNPVIEAKSMGFWKKLGVALHLVNPPYEMAK